MPDDPAAGTTPLALREAFPPITTAEWDAVIRQDLKGADYDKKLLWRTDEGVTVRPYYRAEDLAGLDAQLRSTPGAAPFVRGSGHAPAATADLVVPPDAIRADLLHDAGATAVQELGYALAEGADQVAALVAGGQTVDEAAGSRVFVFAVGSTFFVEVAKLRAARLAWAQVVAAFGPTDAAATRMRLFVRTARANKSLYDPYTNVLRVTTEALSAYVGGCDQLLVEAFGFDPHLATTVPRILAEESHVDVVQDPAGGSYYVETLTDAMAREAWTLLQQVEAQGGYAAARAAGTIDQAVALSRAGREKAVSSRRRTLVGVNNYPDLGEQAPAAAPAPVPGATTDWRLAQPFERLRERTARHARVLGRRPTVLLLTRGDLKMRGARATFSQNFFGCAGFAIVQSERLDGHAADLIVLCSSDPEYLALAQEVCPAVSVPVIVAGNPKDQIAALQAAGVQGFVHVQSDAVSTLTEWQSRLGMEGAAHAS